MDAWKSNSQSTPSFQKLIPPLSNDEFASLKRQIVEQGCLEPLYVWKEGENRFLLDGHNRYKICTENGIRYTFVKVPNVISREEAKLWILEHQAGRRNLTDDQRSVIWNDIREARSKLAVAANLQKARDAKAGAPISAKTTDADAPQERYTEGDLPRGEAAREQAATSTGAQERRPGPVRTGPNGRLVSGRHARS